MKYKKIINTVTFHFYLKTDYEYDYLYKKAKSIYKECKKYSDEDYYGFGVFLYESLKHGLNDLVGIRDPFETLNIDVLYMITAIKYRGDEIRCFSTATKHTKKITKDSIYKFFLNDIKWKYSRIEETFKQINSLLQEGLL